MSTYVRPTRHEEASIMVPVDVQGLYSEVITVLTPTTITEDWTSGNYDVSNFSKILVFLDVTALTGTGPSVTLNIEALDPASGEYAVVNSTDAITAVGLYTLKHDVYEHTIRFRIVLGGTSPSATVSVGAVFKV